MSHGWGWVTMGGYAYYVWSAYGVVLVVLLANGLSIRKQRTRIHNALRLGIRGK